MTKIGLALEQGYVCLASRCYWLWSLHRDRSTSCDMRLKKYLRLQNKVPTNQWVTSQCLHHFYVQLKQPSTIDLKWFLISRFKHCEDSKHLNCDRGFYILLTALQSVWYHFAPQALRLQLCCLRGLSRDEHSYGGMTVNPSFDFIKHTTDLCWVPVPQSAEHYVQLNTKSRKKNPCDILM